MQDRFVGDIGDFGKYGLLRALAGIWPRAEPLLTLGVAWYIPDADTVESTPSGHGQEIEYLFNPKRRDRYQHCDKQLFDRLKQIVCCERHIKAVEESGLLGDRAHGQVIFHDEPIPMPLVGQRYEHRKEWFRCLSEKIGRAQILFLDPDTGLADPKADRAPRKLTHGSKEAARYAFICELEALIDLKQTIVIYQSLGRKKKDTRDKQIDRWQNEYLKKLDLDTDPRIVTTSKRAFIILPARHHLECVDNRLDVLVKCWGGYFRLINASRFNGCP